MEYGADATVRCCIVLRLFLPLYLDHSDLLRPQDSFFPEFPAADSVNFLLRAIAAIKGTSTLLHRDFVQVLIQYAKSKGKYPDFLILFKSSETSATTEKGGISVMKPPLNDYKSGSGHDSNCYIYYVFMHKDLQEFWSKKTKLVGRKRFRLLKTLENKY